MKDFLRKLTQTLCTVVLTGQSFVSMQHLIVELRLQSGRLCGSAEDSDGSREGHSSLPILS